MAVGREDFGWEAAKKMDGYRKENVKATGEELRKAVPYRIEVVGVCICSGE